MDFGTKIFQRLAQRAQTQREMVELSRMDEHLLRDIGLTRDQVRSELMRNRWFG